MTYLALAARVIVGVLLLVSGLGKLANRPEFVRVVATYRLLPQSVVPIFGFALPLAEGIAGVMMLLGIMSPIPAYAACVLFLIFILAITINLLRGSTETECGCFAGRLEKISWSLVLRNLTLTALALLSLGKFVWLSLLLLAVYVITLVIRTAQIKLASTQESTL